MNGLSKFVTTHGRRFEVEVIEPPGAKERRAKKRQQFAKIPLQRTADMAKEAGIPGAMVLVLLHYMAWKAKGAPFPLSNAMLAQYGVSREIKRRILRRLEASGRIKLERRGNCAPIVTLFDA